MKHLSKKGWTDSTGNYHKAACDCGFCDEDNLDAQKIMVKAHEALYMARLAAHDDENREGVEQNDHAIALLWDARKHLQGQKLTQPGLYADRFFAPIRRRNEMSTEEQLADAERALGVE